ncbi:MAG: hypothetical protein AB2A00_37285 [Myxococcota bacterium]
MDLRALSGAVALVGGLFALPASLWWSTTERHSAAAARVLRDLATPSDLIILSSRLSARPDPGGLMRPFGALATVVVDPAGTLPDLSTFPQPRFFLVGEGLDPVALGAPRRELREGGVVEATAPHAGELLVKRMESLVVSVEKDGAVQPCRPPHASGGVRCGKEGWQYVGPVVIKARDRLVACLWSHPVRDHTMHVDIPVTGVSRAALWLQYADDARGEPGRPPINVTTAVDGNTVEQKACSNAGDGRCALDTAIPTGARTLRLSLSTTDAARQLNCLGGELIP